jgi:hypothetical protein
MKAERAFSFLIVSLQELTDAGSKKDFSTLSYLLRDFCYVSSVLIGALLYHASLVASQPPSLTKSFAIWKYTACSAAVRHDRQA